MFKVESVFILDFFKGNSPSRRVSEVLQVPEIVKSTMIRPSLSLHPIICQAKVCNHHFDNFNKVASRSLLTWRDQFHHDMVKKKIIYLRHPAFCELIKSEL